MAAAMPHVVTKPPIHDRDLIYVETDKKSISTKPRIRSSSAGRNPDKSLRARYWAYLFENLERAVDEIYQTCETDESIVECKEAIMILENYEKEFRALIDWIRLSQEFDKTPPPNRPTSLTWEIRKSSLGKFGSSRCLFSPKQSPNVELHKLSFKTVGIQADTEDQLNTSLLIGATEEVCKKLSIEGVAPLEKTSELSEDKSISTDVLEISVSKLDGVKGDTSSDTVCPIITEEISAKVPDKILEEVESKSSCSTKVVLPDSVPEAQPNSKDVAKTANEVVKSSVASKPSSSALSQSSNVNVSSSVSNSQARINSESPIAGVKTSLVQSRILSQRTVRGRGSALDQKRQSYSSSLKLGEPSRTGVARSTHPGVSARTLSNRPAPPSDFGQAAASKTNRSPQDKNIGKQTSAVANKNVPPMLKRNSFSKEAKKTGSSSSLSSTSSSCQSWADKVKGSTPDLEIVVTSEEKSSSKVDDDSEGWETVHRGKSRSKNSPPKKVQKYTTPRGFEMARSPSAPFINSVTRPTKSFMTKTVNPGNKQRSSPPVSNNRIANNKQDRNTGKGPKSAKSLPSLLIESTINQVPDKKISANKGKTNLSKSNNKAFMIKTSEKAVVEKKKNSTEAKLPNQTSVSLSEVNSVLEETDEKVVDDEKVTDDVEEMQNTEENGGGGVEKDDSQEKIDSQLEDSLEGDDFPTQEEAEELVHELGLDWADQMDCLDVELRTPGRALQVHEKLLAQRKRSLSETLRRHEEKQAKAQEQRERFLEEKAQKCRYIVKKVEERKALKEEQQHQRRLIIEKRLQRAAEKREIQLRQKVRKAHDEEEKVNEIAFINTLEAQNKRIDIMSKEKDHEARLQDIQEERQRKQEEKAAKEAAAEERRKALEAERLAKLLEMQEKRKLKEKKIEQQVQEKEKERQELANQKARDWEQRLSALNAAQQATVEELQKKIQQKQEESARRHEENMEQIRQKAFELSVRRFSSNNNDAPRLVPYETQKMCTLCNVLIGSEVYLLSHLRGKKHHEAVKNQHQGVDPSTEELESYNLKHVVDATADKLDPKITFDKERQKAQKKRCKKLKQRMTAKGEAYEKSLQDSKAKPVESKNKFRLHKSVKELNRCLSTQGTGPWDNKLVGSLDRALGELYRTLEKEAPGDSLAFKAVGGIASLIDILSCILKGTIDTETIIPPRCLIKACTVLSIVCKQCYENCEYILHSNKIGMLLDFLIHRLNILMPDNGSGLMSNGPGFISVSVPEDSAAGALMLALEVVMDTLAGKGASKNCESSDFQQNIHDVISYTVSIGTVDKLAQYMNNVRGPVDSDPPQVTQFLKSSTYFITALAKLLCSSSGDQTSEKKKQEDPTHLLGTFRVTELVGSVSLLYGTLLHSGAPSRGDTPPPKLTDTTLTMAQAALRMLNQMAELDLQLLQSVLGEEGLSLQLRHIASYLLWYCTHWPMPNVLHEVILLVGYFAVLSPDNQTVLQSGERPTVLQLLCALPFDYFCNDALTMVLFPTLIACCYGNDQNKAILEQEMSPTLLENYIEECLLDVHSHKKVVKMEDARWVLESRFPKHKWTSAKQFFSDNPQTIAT